MSIVRKNASFRDGKIIYYDTGAGETIILLHGYLESSAVWFDFMPDLAGNFRVLAIDLPGHGASGIFDDQHSMDFMADVVKEVMNKESIEKAMLAGHSMGGYVALAFVEKYPSRLHAYSLFHSHPFADTDQQIKNRKREIKIVESGKKDIIYLVNVTQMFADFNVERFKEKLELHKEIASGIPAKGIIAVLKGMISRPSRIKILEKGEVPLLFIFGKHDNYIPFDEIRDRIKMPPNAEIIVLEKTGHLGFVEEKEKSLAVIMDFYKKQLK
ncbi:MAG TPA: alpha/beta hydrolase [Bacteroidales bacterium]|nr:alpha/beta hydrolase [Bacteroidales bacterium]